MYMNKLQHVYVYFFMVMLRDYICYFQHFYKSIVKILGKVNQLYVFALSATSMIKSLISACLYNTVLTR